jgi:hypothetical protein
VGSSRHNSGELQVSAAVRTVLAASCHGIGCHSLTCTLSGWQPTAPAPL